MDFLLVSDGLFANSLADALRHSGHTVRRVSGGLLYGMRRQLADYDVILVDLPGINDSAKRAYRNLRRRCRTPVVMLLGEIEPEASEDADTYIAGSLPIKGILAAAENLAGARIPNSLRCGDLILDVGARLLRSGSTSVRLTPKQAGLLEALMANSGVVLTRRLLMMKVWHTEYLGDTQTLDVHVSWLRGILGELAVDPQLIQTVRRVGYRFSGEVSVG